MKGQEADSQAQGHDLLLPMGFFSLDSLPAKSLQVISPAHLSKPLLLSGTPPLELWPPSPIPVTPPSPGSLRFLVPDIINGASSSFVSFLEPFVKLLNFHICMHLLFPIGTLPDTLSHGIVGEAKKNPTLNSTTWCIVSTE